MDNQPGRGMEIGTASGDEDITGGVHLIEIDHSRVHIREDDEVVDERRGTFCRHGAAAAENGPS